MKSARIIVSGLLSIGFAIGVGSVHAQDEPSEEHPFVFALESWPAPEEPKGGVVPESAFFESEPRDRRMVKVTEATNNSGSNYIQRLRGWIEAPETGAYRFSIASDDHSELWMSSSEDPADARKIAFVDGYTSPRDFSANPSQVSRPVTLIKGNRYYLEARHRQVNGDSHLSVGWLVPRSEFEEPYVIGTVPDPVFKLEFFRGVKNQDPASHPEFDRPADRIIRRATMATPDQVGSNVLTRLSGVIHPPRDGEYVFMISADDRAALFIALGGDPREKLLVAHLDSWVGPENWEGRPGQVSTPIKLKAGQPVYVELRHFQGSGPGHAKVGWKGPGSWVEQPIRSNPPLPEA